MHISDMMRRRTRMSGRGASRNERDQRKMNLRFHRRGEAWRCRPREGSKQMKRKIEGRMIWDWIILKRSRGWLSWRREKRDHNHIYITHKHQGEVAPVWWRRRRGQRPRMLEVLAARPKVRCRAKQLAGTWQTTQARWALAALSAQMNRPINLKRNHQPIINQQGSSTPRSSRKKTRRHILDQKSTTQETIQPETGAPMCKRAIEMDQWHRCKAITAPAILLGARRLSSTRTQASTNKLNSRETFPRTQGTQRAQQEAPKIELSEMNGYQPLRDTESRAKNTWSHRCLRRGSSFTLSSSTKPSWTTPIAQPWPLNLAATPPRRDTASLVLPLEAASASTSTGSSSKTNKNKQKVHPEEFLLLLDNNNEL